MLLLVLLWCRVEGAVLLLVQTETRASACDTAHRSNVFQSAP